jgi:predicted nucleic acid-binding protein
MIRVVADTNVLISALVFGGLPAVFLDLALLNSALLDELDDKLRTKFKLTSNDADLVRIKLEAVSLIVSSTHTVCVVKEDPDDDRVLECAVSGNANAE